MHKSFKRKRRFYSRNKRHEVLQHDECSDGEYVPFRHPRNWSTPPSMNGNNFSVITYNIMGNARGKDTSYIQEVLRTVMQPIEGSAGDGNSKKYSIVAMQELQRCKKSVKSNCEHCRHHTCKFDHASIILNMMKHRGYHGDFHSRDMTNSVGLFYDPEVFELVSDHFRFVTFDRSNEHRSKKGAILAVLRMRKNQSLLLACAIHLSVPLTQSNEPSTEKPVAELKQLFGKISDIYRRYGELPTVIMGDFNSVYNNVENTQIAKNDVYEMMIANGYQSSYATCDAEPAYTSIKRGPNTDTSNDFIHTIDYIFSRSLTASSVLRVQPIPRNDLPYPSDPSDHLPVAAILSV